MALLDMTIVQTRRRMLWLLVRGMMLILFGGLVARHSVEQPDISYKVQVPSTHNHCQRRRRLQREPLRNLWQAKIGKNGGGYVFFKHIRKAGGTSIVKYLEKVVQYHDSEDDVVFYPQEWFAMDWQCPSLDKERWQNTLSVIVLRHPIERQISEFFYSGPGNQGRLQKLHKLKNHSTEFTQLIRQAMPEWVKNGTEELQEKGKLGRHFSDNFQTRALSGVTTTLPNEFQGINSTCAPWKLYDGTLKANPDWCHMCHGGCDAPCIYGGGWHGGVPANHNLTDESLQHALQVLESFDIVLLTESYEDQADLIADVFGVPLSYASVASVEANVRVHRASVTERLNGYQNVLGNTAPELLDLLARNSQFELSLYKRAVEINKELIQQWREEKIAGSDTESSNEEEGDDEDTR